MVHIVVQQGVDEYHAYLTREAPMDVQPRQTRLFHVTGNGKDAVIARVQQRLVARGICEDHLRWHVYA